MGRVIEFPRRSRPVHKIIAEFSPEVYATLHRLAEEEGINVSTVLNRTVQVYDMIVRGEVGIGRRRLGIFWQAGRIERPVPDDVALEPDPDGSGRGPSDSTGA